METRVIVASNARARIFATHSVINALQEVEDFIHSEAHMRNQDLVSDSPGKSRDPHGTLDTATSPREHQSGLFARSLAARLKELHNQQHYTQLILIAPPKFLGLLREALPKPLDQLVTRTIGKDLTGNDMADIIEYIKT